MSFNRRLFSLFLLICFALVPLAGCTELADDGPQISSVTVSPNTISQTVSEAKCQDSGKDLIECLK